MIPILPITATMKLTLKAPTKTKNSPTNPLVPGKPKVAKTKTINSKEYFGSMLAIPPYDLINLECVLSYKTPTQRKSAAEIKP